MTKQAMHTITCPSCHREQNIVHWDSLNATLNPELKERLLRGELMIFTCESCGHRASVVSPVLYHDVQRCLMFWLVPDGRIPEAQLPCDLLAEYTCRVVKIEAELLEKIRIFDDGLDDRMVEAFKIIIQLQANEEGESAEGLLLYLGIEDEPPQVQFALVTDEGEQALTASRRAFREVSDDLAECVLDDARESPAWRVVDAEYDMALLDQLSERLRPNDE